MSEHSKESGGQFLQRVGMDGLLWADEMNKRFPSIPVDDLLCWCCNMIMAGYDGCDTDSVNKVKRYEEALEAMLEATEFAEYDARAGSRHTDADNIAAARGKAENALKQEEKDDE